MESFSVNLGTQLSFRGFKIHISATTYVKNFATTFCTLAKLGKKCPCVVDWIMFDEGIFYSMAYEFEIL